MSKKEYKPRDPGDAGLYSSQPRVNPEEETANPSRPRGLVFRTASEIVANAVEPDWVLDGYLARGAVTLLSAREKVGKTTLALAALRAIQAGTPFMGRETMRTGVVYLSEETGATLPEKLARFELGDEGLVWLTRDMTGGISDFRDVMAAVVEEAARRGAGMVVVDTLAYWAGLKDDDENSSGAMLTAFRPILDAASAGLCVLVIHHNARQSGEYRGSTAIGGVVDVILSLTEDEAHGARRNLKARSRFGATPARLRVELQGNSFVSLGDPAAVAHRDCEDAVVEAIAASGLVTDPKTGERVKVTRDILIQQTGLSEFKVQGYLRSLEASGRVTKIGTGKRGAPFVYELAAEEAARRTARSATGAADTAIALSPREGTEAAAGLEQQVLEVIERTTTTISKARIAEILGLADPVVEGAIVVLEARGQISDPYHNRRHLRRVTDDDEGY